MIIRQMILVKGVVQGVGFRPFIYRIARENGLKGRVINTSEGVQIDVEGSEEAIRKFTTILNGNPPPLAKIEEINIHSLKPIGFRDFAIQETESGGTAEAFVSVDVAVCEDCLREMFDPGNRRYRYPLINCTNCGPRFTIIKDIPYDREFTTMNVFPMCPECSLEYHDPSDRRFHAQPTACVKCGPEVILRDPSGGVVDKHKPIDGAAHLLKESCILAIKGLGGYHLACNAKDHHAVPALRQRKVREDKPFAVMVHNLEEARQLCYVSEKEADLLTSPARPIVLLKKKGETVAPEVAPGNAYLGIMLPYTPLHYLLLEKIDFPLVMTSANLSNEPIAYQDEDAFMRLGDIAEYFLTHNRKIEHRCDDSVTRVFMDREYPLRRSRGYSPVPLKLASEGVSVFAVGGEQKNTFCLTKGKFAFLSHHIGDLENLETLEAFHNETEMYRKLFHVEPELIAYDFHPEYLSTKYALDIPGLTKVGVQHHHAHIAACMAENGLDGNVLGVSFDGTGFGPDGSIWGGEFMYASLTDFKRFAHLKYTPMPGGARAIKEPWRMAAGYLFNEFGRDWKIQESVGFLKNKNGMLLEALEEIMEKWINCPPTSSMGRLFDAVAALIGIRDTVNYEGQAAVEMEQAAVRAINKVDINYNYVTNLRDSVYEIDTGGIISGVLDDLSQKEDESVIAWKFHNTIKDMVVSLCKRGREEFGENRVCLSGGVFQNLLLLDMVYRELTANKFNVYIHRLVPANDGNISLGQAVVARERRKLGCV